MTAEERDRAHRAQVKEFLDRNPGIVARAQGRRRARLKRLGLAGGRR